MVNEVDDDLKGFKDLFDDDTKNKKNKASSRSPERYGLEHLNFIQNDQNKLIKIIDMFENKLGNQFNFDQMSTFLDKQTEENRLHREELFRIFNQKESAFNQSMRKIFNFHFKDFTKSN
jgi:hypothetical protein